MKLPLVTESGRNETEMHGIDLWKVEPNKVAGVVKRAVGSLAAKSSSKVAYACMACE